MAGPTAHWDDVEPRPIPGEQLRGVRGRLGPEMGAVRTGLSRYDAAPGERPMPLHTHADEDEIAFVLRGSGIVTDGRSAWAVGEHDTIAWVAGGPPHTFVAGDDGLSILIFGSGSDTGLTYLPRAGAMWLGPRWLPIDGPNPFKLEEQAGPLELPDVEPGTPPHVVPLADAPVVERDFSDVRVTRRRTGAAAGATRAGLTHTTVAPGRCSSVPHVHAGDEELFVVLEGDGRLLLHDTSAELLGEFPVRPGSLVARPGGGDVAHSFRAGDDGLVLLAFSGNAQNDLCFYPRSQKLSVEAFGITMRVEQVPYADGEPSSS